MKPQHKIYDNTTFPDTYNAGLDEMEAYYEPLLSEALEALRKIKAEINRWAPFLEGYETAPPIGMKEIEKIVVDAILNKHKEGE